LKFLKTYTQISKSIASRKRQQYKRNSPISLKNFWRLTKMSRLAKLKRKNYQLSALLSEGDITFLMHYGKGESVTDAVRTAIQRLRTLDTCMHAILEQENEKIPKIPKIPTKDPITTEIHAILEKQEKNQHG
jgi:hypothetical protein